MRVSEPTIRQWPDHGTLERASGDRSLRIESESVVTRTAQLTNLREIAGGDARVILCQASTERLINWLGVRDGFAEASA